MSEGAVNDGLERRPGGPRRIVVLGTGTDVGKTYVAARLCEALRARGTRVLGLKPIESGFTDEHTGDAAALRAAAGLGARPLYGFVEPIGPHLAARRANTVIELEHVLGYVAEQERAQAPEVCVIET
ncbi:MAG TPA: dethiobiotin synthase, partial [Polyangiaceae bacterium]|nr:dethiobiotin synthase [Polyangiaceae bacterium]